eukprot:GHVT01034153.1.p1 GENE.GHVT01034153.1~~GHVT01034153.1.p1  ORF type:complete len:410 (+),score=56.73 GHVT01034153.1:220-1449(+)
MVYVHLRRLCCAWQTARLRVSMEKVEADQMPRVLHPSFKVARDVGMNPGNKLNSLLALHIRRALEDADVPTLALLGRTFACPGRPFTGDMREDTIDLFLRRIVNFPARHLSPCLPSLSSALAWAVSYPHRVDGSVSVVPLNPAQTSCCWQLLSDACKWLLVGPENFAATGTRPTAHGAEEPGKLPQQQSGHAGADTGGETSKPGLPSATEQQPSEDSILARLHPDELERFRDPEAYLGTPNQLARPLRIVNAIKTREKLNPEQLQALLRCRWPWVFFFLVFVCRLSHRRSPCARVACWLFSSATSRGHSRLIVNNFPLQNTNANAIIVQEDTTPTPTSRLTYPPTPRPTTLPTPFTCSTLLPTSRRTPILLLFLLLFLLLSLLLFLLLFLPSLSLFHSCSSSSRCYSPP